MEVALKLKQWLPELKIIHLLRDPRTTVPSRLTHEWALHGGTSSFYASRMYEYITGKLRSSNVPLSRTYYDSVLRPEMYLYCDMVRRNELNRLKLEQLYPGSTKNVYYEDLVKNPNDTVQDLLRFLESDNRLQYDRHTFLHSASEGYEEYLKKLEFMKMDELTDVFQRTCLSQMDDLKTVFNLIHFNFSSQS